MKNSFRFCQRGPAERAFHTCKGKDVGSITTKRRQKILIVDDSEMNRSILADILGEEYEILEAEDGVKAVEALQKYGTAIDLVLLDIVMPEMDGFEVLTLMNQKNWIEDIPVIMISAESTLAHVERAYNLGVTDFISRPFNALVVHRRVANTSLLYAKQKKLVNLASEQIYEKERQNRLMIDILSHIVESRNGESGMHVLHIHTLTEMLLRHLVLKTDRYQISYADIALIANASALHDIGKISIPSEVLNKPGRLTDEEFEIMKTHTTAGDHMLSNMSAHQNEPLVKMARAICRWHHERYDGRGYPDGLKGDDIPISAQIVALADVYDALTSERVYKKAIPHETAVQMILDGQCGTFNPLLLECLTEIAGRLAEEFGSADCREQRTTQLEMRSVAEEMHRYEELSASDRTLQLLEHERMKYSFFAAMSQEIQFEFALVPPMVTINAWGASKLELKETVMDPLNNGRVLSLLGAKALAELSAALHSTTPAQPVASYDTQINLDGEMRWYRIVARAIWTSDEPPQYTGAIGKAIDIHDSRMKLAALEHMATHDTLTGLLNHASARERVIKRLESRPDGYFALVIVDLDYFKSANDNYGHIFGDRVLKYLAAKLCDNIRGADIAARVGGDEFLLFLEYHGDVEPIISRIFHSISSCSYEDFSISISMGVACTDVVGTDYEDLLRAADQALYSVKRSSRGQFHFYDDTMHQMLSAISPIDESVPPAGGTNQESEDVKR